MSLAARIVVRPRSSRSYASSMKTMIGDRSIILTRPATVGERLMASASTSSERLLCGRTCGGGTIAAGGGDGIVSSDNATITIVIASYDGARIDQVERNVTRRSDPRPVLLIP